MIVWQQQNAFLRVELMDDGSAQVTDCRTGEVWQMGRVAFQEDNAVDVGHCWLRTERSMCEEYPGRFHLEPAGDQGILRVTLFGWEGRVVGQFSIEPRLVDQWLEFRLFDIDESIPSLVYPTPIVTESLVFPQNVGRWVRKPFPFPQRYWWVYPVHLRMRWFGGLRGDHGWIAILHEGYTDGGTHVAEMSAAPAWLPSMGRWSGDRIVRYGFTSGGYVGLAKAYRAYAIEQGMFRSLRDKLEDLPAARNLPGSDLLSFFQGESFRTDRYEDLLQPVPSDLASEGDSPRVYITYADAQRLIHEAQGLGVNRALAVLRGWIKGGYDESHPDIFPLETAYGTMDELRDLLALNSGVTVALHDNYQDIYPQSESFPQGVIRNMQGEMLRGGIWAGGQSYLIKAPDGVRNARRNWQTLSGLNPRAMFVDTTIAVQWYEDYTADSPMSRAQDKAAKEELLQFFREQRQVVGSEEGADFGVPYVEWIENRHRRIAGESIPLWGLVFHDAAFCARYLRPTHDYLTDMLWGYMLLWDFRQPEGWDALLSGIAATRPATAWHGRIALDEMLSHRYLTDDGQVEETVFSSGAAITINFADEPRTVDGLLIPGQGYVIRD